MKMLFLLGLLCSCTLLLPFSVFGQSTNTIQHGTRPVHISPVIYDWLTERWTGDNKPYHAARTTIDISLAQGTLATAIASQYYASKQEKPYDPLVQYRWAYATGQAVLASRPLDENKLLAALHAIEGAVPPHTYDYTRLHFLLLTVRPPRFDSKLEIVGEKLLQKNPQDSAVKRQLISLLGNSPLQTDRDKAVTYATEMVKHSPNNPDYHAVLASAYLDRWFAGQQPTAKAKAMEEFQMYLQLAPSNAEFRPRAAYLVKTLQQWGAKKQ